MGWFGIFARAAKEVLFSAKELNQGEKEWVEQNQKQREQEQHDAQEQHDSHVQDYYAHETCTDNSSWHDDGGHFGGD